MSASSSALVARRRLAALGPALLLLALSGCGAVPGSVASRSPTSSPTSTRATTPSAPAPTSVPTSTATRVCCAPTPTPEAAGGTSLYLGLTGSSRRFVALLPGGRILQGYPAEGLGGIDPDTATSAGGGSAGRYAASGGTLSVEWSDGQQGSGTIDDSGLRLYDQTYVRVSSPSPGSLAGTFGRQSGSAGGATITFDRAGTFVDEGITGQTALLTTDSPSGPGRYTIADYTLYLTYAGGNRQRFGLYLLPQNVSTSPDQLELGGYTFVRQ
jgi:hypothetical protein